MKRAVLSFLSAIAFAWIFSMPLDLLGISTRFNDVMSAMVPVLTLLFYYGRSHQALSQEQNELLRELLRGQQTQDDAEEDGEESKGETLKEDSPSTESVSK